MKHTIDCTPKWENLIPMFFQWIQDGTPEQRQHARDEIKRLAKAADIFMAHRRHGGLTCKCGETFNLN